LAAQQERRLAAVMFTDLVGYTALSQANEARAISSLEGHRGLLRPLFSKHNGREVKTIGDAFLVEFDSALEAVECAIDIQKAVHEEGTGSSRGASVRIGIHVGDVVHRQGDVYGDAVNIASRIYPLARAGEVCISRQVYDQVSNKLPYPLTKLEPTELKNVFVRIDVYRVELPWTSRKAENREGSLPADRIAVLPFVNISPDPNDEYFADGLTEELIANLSLVKGLKVIARTSVMNYKKKEMNVSEIGRELEVGTIVEGSVRKALNRIRVTVQVIDVSSEEHLWASNYDASLDDVFAVQSDIARKVTESLPGTLRSRRAPEVQRDTNDVTAYINFLKGREQMYAIMEAPLRESIESFQRAIDRDPNFARAYVGMAQSYLSLATRGHVAWEDSMETSRVLLNRALSLNDDLAEAHAMLSYLALMSDELTEVMEREARKAIELNPNLADGHVTLGLVKALDGDPEKWVSELETAHQLDPLSTRVIELLSGAYLYTGRDANALELLRKTEHVDPLNTHRFFWLHDVIKGDLDAAHKQVAELERLEPKWEFTLLAKGYLAGLEGDRATAEAMISALEVTHKRGYARSSLAGYIYHALGDMDTFYAYMQAAAEDHTLRAQDILYSPLFAEARKDPRMRQIVETTGLKMPQGFWG
jgi:adenylate cyclase